MEEATKSAMTMDEIVGAIHATLRDIMSLPHLEAFGPGARLNEDLYLDSILLMQLLLNLELELGLTVPEEVINRQDVATVAGLAALLAGGAASVGSAPAPTVPPSGEGEGVHGEDYVDLKIHCVVSCLSHALKQAPAIDHRPFYFGVWDADFTVGEDFALTYHVAGIDHSFYLDWYRRLYGVEVEGWYDHGRSKLENIATFLALLEARRPSEYLMVMLDLFHLPERENKFNQNPFPHYLMVETTADPEVWRVLDPDFRWEGEIPRETMLQAIAQPTVAGGFVFDRTLARAPLAADIAAYFEACFRPEENPLTAATRRIVAAHLAGENGVHLGALGHALRELPVILIRKYAYEHGFAFFWRSLKLDNPGFDHWCDEIETLIQEFRALHYLVMKLARTEDRSLAPAISAQLSALDRIERGIKAKMAEVFGRWCAANGLTKGDADLLPAGGERHRLVGASR